MHWYQTALMLERGQFQRLTCNHQEINFYFKQIEGKVYIFTLVDATKRYYYEDLALISLKDELERKFLLRGAKDVETLFIIYTPNLEFYKKLMDSGLKVWIANIATNSLMIYENQPDDFLDMRKQIEEVLFAKPEAKKLPRPIITIGLVAINVLIYLMMYIFTSDSEKYVSMFGNCWADVFIEKEYFRLFTAMFLHSDANHLVNNMLSLAVIGNETEQKTGHLHFSVIYIVSGILASLCSALYYMHTSNSASVLIVSIGASGAIFGLYGAYIVISLMSNHKNGRRLSVPRIVIVTLLLLSNGLTGENIDNMAHLAGLIVGIILSFIYCKCDKNILK